jgi:hypothetical protein
VGVFRVMSAGAVAREHTDVAIPLVGNAAELGLVADESEVRTNDAGELVWVCTKYYARDLSQNPVVIVRADPGYPLPIPVWPSGSPTSGLTPPERIAIRGLPAVLVQQGPTLAARWIEAGVLYTVEMNNRLTDLAWTSITISMVRT